MSGEWNAWLVRTGVTPVAPAERTESATAVSAALVPAVPAFAQGSVSFVTEQKAGEVMAYRLGGTRVFNGARIGERSEVRIGAIVHLRTVLPPESVVPIGWVAVGDPAQMLSPDRHEEIWALQKDLDFPGYVFGLDRETPDLMIQLTERYGAALARHAADRRLD